MQETDAFEEPLLGSNKTDDNGIYYSHNNLESVQDEVLDLSLGNVSLDSVPQSLNKFGLDLTVNKNGDNTTIFDDNNYFIKNHVYKLLPITFEEIDQELIYKEHDYCSISSGSDKEQEFSKTMEISLIKSRVYRRKREKSTKKGNKNGGLRNGQGNNTLGSPNDSIDTIHPNIEKDSQLEELDFSQINLHAKTLMHHSEVDYSKLLQPLDLTPNFDNQNSTEIIVEDENDDDDDDGPCSPESNVLETNESTEDSNDIVVEIMRPDCKDYRPCRRFLSEVSQLVPLLNKSDHGKINILDLSSENVDGSNGHKTYYCIYEDTWKMFQSSERMTLTNDRSICTPVSADEKDGTPTYLLFDEDSLKDALGKHSQDIGASLNYRLLKDFHGTELTESNRIPEILEVDDLVERNSESAIAESEIVAMSADESIENSVQDGGIINSGLLQKLLTSYNTSGLIKCNECLEETNPCSKCMESMNKTYINRTSQNSEKYFTKISSKKHWNRMINIKHIFDSNPIVQEIKSKKRLKKKDLKGKSSKKKIPTSNERNDSRGTFKKNDAESKCNETSSGIINSGFLKAFLMNSNNDQNNSLVNHLNNETTENLVVESDVDNLNQVGKYDCPGPSFHGCSNFVNSFDSVEKSSETNADTSDKFPKKNMANKVSKKAFNSVGFPIKKKGEPSLNNENIPDLEGAGAERKKISGKRTKLKKPRRSLEISIEEIADLGLGVEKRTRSGREAPQILTTKNLMKKSNNNLINIKKECEGENATSTKDTSGNGEELVANRVNESESETGAQSILKSLLLDAARKIAEPSESPILCDILPNMENLSIPITGNNINSIKNQNKLSGAEKEKGSNKRRKKLKLNNTLKPDNSNPDIVSRKEAEVSETAKNHGDDAEKSSEQDVLFFENNVNQDESNKSQLELKEVCMKLENNIAEDLGILSIGLNNSDCNGRPEKAKDLETNEEFKDHDTTQEKYLQNIADITNNNPSPGLSNSCVEEKNNESTEVMLRLKKTISEKLKTTANHIDEDCNNELKKLRARPKKYSLKNTDFKLNVSDCNNGEPSSTKKMDNSIPPIIKNSKTTLSDKGVNFQRRSIKIKNEANEEQKIKLNGNSSKNNKNHFKNQKSKVIAEKSTGKNTNDPIVPFQNRLRSQNKEDSACSKIEVKDINKHEIQETPTLGKNRHLQKTLKRKESSVDVLESSKKLRSSKKTSENMITNSENGNNKTSQPNKKIKCDLLEKFISPQLENNRKRKSFGDPVSDPSFSYERTTRSGKVIECSAVVENSKIELPAKKKHHDLILLNIKEPESEIVHKKEINLRRRTIDCSFSKDEKRTEDNIKNEVVLKGRKSAGYSFESKNGMNKSKIRPRISERLRNK